MIGPINQVLSALGWQDTPLWFHEPDVVEARAS